VADFEVKISITSPLDSVDSSGTSLPLTRAPMLLWPDLGVHRVREVHRRRAGRQRDDVALGVKTYTSWLDRSKRSASRNSLGSLASRCQSSSCRSQVISSMCAGGPDDRGALLLLVLPVRGDAELRRTVHREGRICISTGLPVGPMTVVCNDWYMLNFGIAM
jgi:hypothetical protein